jgi:hypothetical protein
MGEYCIGVHRKQQIAVKEWRVMEARCKVVGGEWKH